MSPTNMLYSLNTQAKSCMDGQCSKRQSKRRIETNVKELERLSRIDFRTDYDKMTVNAGTMNARECNSHL